MVMDYQPLDISVFSAQLQRNVAPDAPGGAKMMAARGMLPVGPADLAMLTYQLHLDVDPKISKAAADTMGGAPDEVVRGATAAPIDGQVLDWLAHLHFRSAVTMESVLLNRCTFDETFVWAAGQATESISELIATNEVRLLRTPEIIEALYMNPKARQSTLDRVIDLARRNGVKFEHLTILKQLVEDHRYDTERAAADSTAAASSGKDEQFKDLLAESLKRDADDSDDIRKEIEEDEKEGGTRNKSLQTKLLGMNISGKVRMATLGSAQEREFLVKDNNRLVHMAAATSPKAQLKDVVSWSGNRTIPVGVLEFIANHRRYRRMYNVCVNLVNNPRCPIKHSTRIMPSLVDRDLKALTRNRNVPAVVQRQVKQIIDAKAKKR
ncbi:MAG: hypothetical protein ACI81R_003159 [Bradymonadia bacterium]|jgi:hypothetical protein